MKNKKLFEDTQEYHESSDLWKKPELLAGHTLAYSRKVKLVGDNLVAPVTPKERGKVGIVSLGGIGHEPAHIGYAGKGLLDLCVPGEISADPGPRQPIDMA